MPHKVNPIDFENAEGNLGLANSMFGHFSEKLPISRFQRDLTDSTVLRSMGVPMSYSLISYLSIETGVGKLQVNRNKLEKDLEDHWEVIAEAYQTILRREGVLNAYELVKNATRGNTSAETKQSMLDLIESFPVTDAVKEQMRQITPHNFIGV